MSAFNNQNTNAYGNRASNLASTDINDDRQNLQHSGLNENHGIAATGLNEPHTHATIPTSQGISGQRGADNLNYSGPPIADMNKVDQRQNLDHAGHHHDHHHDHHTAGLNNPSQTNRTAGTGIPPVNTAEHAHINAATVGAGTGANPTGIDANRHRHNHEQNNLINESSAARSQGDHGASLDRQSHGRGLATDATTTGAATTGAAGTVGTFGADGQRHAGVPQHDGMGKTANEVDQNVGGATDNKPSVGDKIKGKIEKLAGKATGNEARIEKGEEIAHGNRI